eukprot:595356_1
MVNLQSSNIRLSSCIWSQIIISIPSLLSLLHIVWTQNQLYYQLSNHDDIINRWNQFICHTKIWLKSTTLCTHPLIPLPDVATAFTYYETFNSDIHVQNTTFHRLSFPFMFSTLYNTTVLFHGDSFCRKFWRYIVFVMHQYYTNGTTSDVDPIERAVWNALLNTADINASLTIDHPSSQWLLRTEMDKIGATEREEYAVTNNVKENLWYTVLSYSRNIISIKGCPTITVQNGKALAQRPITRSTKLFLY